MSGPEWQDLERTDSSASSTTWVGSPDTSLEAVGEEEAHVNHANTFPQIEVNYVRPESLIEALVSPGDGFANDGPPDGFWQRDSRSKVCIAGPEEEESPNDGPPQGFWEKDSESKGPGLKAANGKGHDDVRNTKFYGFYDDLMVAYEQKRYSEL